MSSFKAQQWNSEQSAKNARFVSDLGMPVVELLTPQPKSKYITPMHT